MRLVTEAHFAPLCLCEADDGETLTRVYKKGRAHAAQHFWAIKYRYETSQSDLQETGGSVSAMTAAYYHDLADKCGKAAFPALPPVKSKFN